MSTDDRNASKNYQKEIKREGVTELTQTQGCGGCDDGNGNSNNDNNGRNGGNGGVTTKLDNISIIERKLTCQLI